MRRSGLVLVLAWGWLGCARSSPQQGAPPDAAGPALTAADDAALPEPQLLVPLTQPPPRPSPLKVELPPEPELDRPEVPLQYDDGAYSIAGLRDDRDARFAEGAEGQEITVRAYLSRIYVPPECPQGERCPPSKQPHLWMTDARDDPGLRRALLVVGYQFQIPEWEAKRWKGVPLVVMEQGKQYTLRGRFKQFSDTGFAHSNGLLEFVAYRPHDPETGEELPQWIAPPGAPWHPLELERQDELDQQLRERAKAAARAKQRGSATR